MYSHSDKSLALGQISLSIRNPGFALALHNNYSFLFIFHFHILLFSHLIILTFTFLIYVGAFLPVCSFLHQRLLCLSVGRCVNSTDPTDTSQAIWFPHRCQTPEQQLCTGCEGNSPIKNPKYQLCSSLILTGRES